MNYDPARYYTPQSVSDLMIELLTDTPRSVIDICAGSWNLLSSAFHRWPHAAYTGVDIRPTLIPREFSGISAKSIVSDGRVFSAGCMQNGTRYDLVVGNPPFGYEPPDKKLTETLSTLPLPKTVLNGTVFTRLEATMLLVNTTLVADNGTLAIIVPDTVVSSERFANVRRYLLENFNLEQIVELPNTVFGSKNTIQTFILILKRSKQSQPDAMYYRVWKLDHRLTLERPQPIPSQQVVEGNWTCVRRVTMAPVNGPFQIIRGQAGTNRFSSRNHGPKVIHSSNVLARLRGLSWGSTYRTSSSDDRRYVQTKRGDILIVRVGKAAGVAAVWDSAEPAIISDCLLAVRSDDELVRQQLLDALLDQSTQVNIGATAHGVAARHITIGALRQLLGGATVLAK